MVVHLVSGFVVIHFFPYAKRMLLEPIGKDVMKFTRLIPMVALWLASGFAYAAIKCELPDDKVRYAEDKWFPKQFVFQAGTRNGEDSASILGFQPIGTYTYHEGMPFAKWKGNGEGRYRTSGTLMNRGRIMIYSGEITIGSNNEASFRWNIENSNWIVNYKCRASKVPRDFSITDFSDTLDQIPLVEFYRESSGKIAGRSRTKGFALVTVPNPCPYNVWSTGGSGKARAGRITNIVSDFYTRYNGAYAELLHPEALDACLSLIYVATQNGKTSQLFHLHDGVTSIVEIKLKGRDGSEDTFKAVGEFNIVRERMSAIYDEKLQQMCKGTVDLLVCFGEDYRLTEPASVVNPFKEFKNEIKWIYRSTNDANKIESMEVTRTRVTLG